MKFTDSEIQEIARNHYNLDCEIKSLNGYDEENYLLTNNDSKFILKVATEEHGFHLLDAQIAVSKHLISKNNAYKIQSYLVNEKSEEITTISKDNQKCFIRILSFLEGEFWVDKKNKTPELNQDLGSFVGKLDADLKGFNHAATNRYYEWDLKNTLDARRNLHHIKSHENRRIVSYFLLQFEMEVLPILHTLRSSVIHNDINDYNVLTRENTINGLIDFGDVVHSQTINNLAIACTYAMLDSNDPLSIAYQVIKGYHEKYPLTEKEVNILYYLIAARLCISLTKSAFNASLDTDNEHHFITEKPALFLINQLIKINPIKAEDSFRKACGFSTIINQEDTYEELMKDRKHFIGKNLSISYNKKLKIDKAALQYLYDDKGNTYVDCVNNVSHVGHCHPTVVKQMQIQLAKLNTNTRYLNDNIVDYAKKLTATLPESLSVCYFTNSGSEANDLAIRISRFITQQKDVVVLDHAYHGTSTVAIELSPYKFDGKGGSGKMPYIHKAQNPDTYRGPFKSSDDKAGEKYASDVKRIIDDLAKEGKGISAFICETLLGVGGQIPLPKNYLNEVYGYIKAAGGLCIADEVQVGFGRVGSKFWGFELQDCLPDIVVLGKPIGNGHPLAAVVTTQEIADKFNNGMEYFNTFGGNPVSMATGLSVLNVIEEEELQNNALEVGNVLLEGMRKLMDKYEIIGDVRGHGLFVGAELVRDRVTLEPAITEIDIVVEKLKYRGFLISTDGPLYNVLKIKPPLVFSKENANDFVRNLDEVLSEL